MAMSTTTATTAETVLAVAAAALPLLSEPVDGTPPGSFGAIVGAGVMPHDATVPATKASTYRFRSRAISLHCVKLPDVSSRWSNAHPMVSWSEPSELKMRPLTRSRSCRCWLSAKVKHSSTAVITPLTICGETIKLAVSHDALASHRARHSVKLSWNGPSKTVTFGTMMTSLFSITTCDPRIALTAKLTELDRLEHAVGEVRRKSPCSRLQTGSTSGAFGQPRRDSASARACRGQNSF
mmetsp:Transcript_12550/g.32106  ORF Transcript_12550/g.32106 Transcript_12550/m.32106 type:complete len:238 (+) Transcript_12550:1022-1735(+)